MVCLKQTFTDQDQGKMLFSSIVFLGFKDPIFKTDYAFPFADLAFEPPWESPPSLPDRSPVGEAAPLPTPTPSPRNDVTPPKPAPRSIRLPPSGRKFKSEDFQLLKVLGKGSFGKVSANDLLIISVLQFSVSLSVLG